MRRLHRVNAIDHIKANLLGYLLPVVAMLMWAGVMAFMDARHDSKGAALDVEQKALEQLSTVEHEVLSAVQQAEVRQLKRELRTVKDRLRLAPNSEYSASRQAEVDFLTDQIQELE